MDHLKAELERIEWALCVLARDCRRVTRDYRVNVDSIANDLTAAACRIRGAMEVRHD